MVLMDAARAHLLMNSYGYLPHCQLDLSVVIHTHAHTHTHNETSEQMLKTRKNPLIHAHFRLCRCQKPTQNAQRACSHHHGHDDDRLTE